MENMISIKEIMDTIRRSDNPSQLVVVNTDEGKLAAMYTYPTLQEAMALGILGVKVLYCPCPDFYNPSGGEDMRGVGVYFMRSGIDVIYVNKEDTILSQSQPV